MPQDRIKLNEQITVGSQPDEAQLKHLVAEGFKSIINLRTDDEKDQTLSPVDEGDKAQHLGLIYEHLPVTADDIKPAQVDRFREVVANTLAPVYVHCAKGKRAAAMAIMQIAVAEGLSGDQAIDKAQQMGCDCDSAELKDFVKSYVDSQR